MHKFLRFFKKKKYSMYENRVVRDYRDGKVTKEELDALSTCDMCATVNDGLSDASKELLKTTKLGRFMTKEEVADLTYELCENSNKTGQVINIDAGQNEVVNGIHN